MEAESKGMLWAGRVISALPTLLMLFGGSLSVFVRSPELVSGFTKYGYSADQLPVIGGLELACAILYAIPQTSVLGAILITGYMGGAVATHVRAGEMTWWVAVTVGVLVWLGLFLRDARLRALLPIVSRRS